jgi:hypothetical protein
MPVPDHWQLALINSEILKAKMTSKERALFMTRWKVLSGLCGSCVHAGMAHAVQAVWHAERFQVLGKAQPFTVCALD